MMTNLGASRSRFDRAVALFSSAVLLIIGAVIWRGDQVGLQVVAFSPANTNSTVNPVSVHSRLQVRFDQAIISDTKQIHLTLSPPVSGTLQTSGDNLVFVPRVALQSNTAYTVTIAAGLPSQQGRRLRKAVSWRFQTSLPQVLYAAADTINTQQLFVTSLDFAKMKAEAPSAEPHQLTFGPVGVWDFAAGLNGNIAYSVLEESGASDLWLIAPGAKDTAKLLDCQQAVCNSTAWSPDNRFLAFSKRNIGAMSPPRLWLLDLQTGKSAPLLADDQRLGFEPRWSADQHWLSYLAPDQGGVGVRNLTSNGEHFYPTTSGEAGIWHPQRNQLLISVVQPLKERAVVHLWLVDPIAGTQHNLSGKTNFVEDNAPAWSPDGAWIAFRRKELAGPHATLGAQVWRMRADGSEASALTSDPKFDHGQLSWSPDGRYLLFQKLPLKGLDVTISVWLLDVKTGQQWEIAKAGQRPIWMP